MRRVTRAELTGLGLGDDKLAEEYQRIFGISPPLRSDADDTAELQARRGRMFADLSIEWQGQLERRPGEKIGSYSDVRRR